MIHPLSFYFSNGLTAQDNFSDCIMSGREGERERGREKQKISSPRPLSLLLQLASLFLIFGFITIGDSTNPDAVTFSDVTEEAGIHFKHINGKTEKKYVIETMGSGAVFFDYNNDGYLDIYVVNSGYVSDTSALPFTGNVLYRSEGDGRFTEVTKQSGSIGNGYGMGAVAGDYDNDGDQDLYLTNFGLDILYRNNGDGTFTEVTQKAKTINPLWSVSGAFLDFDRDGDLDLFVANYLEFDFSMKPCFGKGEASYCHPSLFNGTADILYRNNGDGTFSDISLQAGVVNPAEGKGLGVAVGDYNNDNWPDIYVANDTTRNFLYHNNGDGTFTDVSLFAGCGYDENGVPEGGMGVDIGDYNNDGWLDIWVVNSSGETNTLYKNNGDETFSDVTDETQLGEPSYAFLSFGTKLFDYDNDGDLDIFVANGHVQDIIELLTEGFTYAQTAQMFKNNGSKGNGTFEEVSSLSGSYFLEPYVGRGAAFGDYDNDGDVDAFVVNCNQKAFLLRNEGGNKNNWIGIKLIGARSNRDGIGVRVKIACDGQTQIKEVQSGASYASDNDRKLLFGLGEKKKVDLIEIKWPNGVVQILKDVGVNQMITVIEGL